MRNMREIVKKGYENGDYCGFYRLSGQIDDYPLEKANIDRLSESLPKGAKILDLGCGSGIPFDKYLADLGFRITGVDFVQKHIDAAHDSIPNGVFILGDIAEVHFQAGSFDAVLSLYTIFHIPRQEHRNLLRNVRRVLSDRGYLLVTMGTIPEDEEEVGPFIGSEMAWSSYSMEENLRMVEESGFNVLHWAEEGELGLPEHHLWILARKK